MTRMAGDAIVVRPTNNVYTVLVIIAFLVEAVAFALLFMRAQTIFQPGGIL